MKRITAHQLLAFAKKSAGKSLLTLKRKRPFVLDVIGNKIVFYPESHKTFWLETGEYVRHFNLHNSLNPGDYPRKLWNNSYFVSLADALLNGTKPFVAKPTNTLEIEVPEPPSPKLDAKVRQLRRLGKMPPPVGQIAPQKRKQTSLQIYRDPAVKAWVLRVSEGKCSCCLKSAPFKDDDGLPFLEVHHVIPLADGGHDTISNAVAICPNCHRACHHSKWRKKIVAQLYKRFPRLK